LNSCEISVLILSGRIGSFNGIMDWDRFDVRGGPTGWGSWSSPLFVLMSVTSLLVALESPFSDSSCGILIFFELSLFLPDVSYPVL